MKTLIIKYSSFGDVVGAIPLAEVIHRQSSEEHVSWLVEEKYSDLLLGNPYIEEVIPFKKEKLPWVVFSLIKQLRSRSFDKVIDPQGLFLSGLLTFLSGARSRVGFANAREGACLAYTRKVKVPSDDINAVRRYLLLLDDNVRQDEAPYYIPRKEGAAQKLEVKLKKKGCRESKPIILLCPTSRWQTKNWPLVRYLDLAQKLAEAHGNKIIFIGSPDDLKEHDVINDRLGEVAVNFLGQNSLPLSLLIALFDKADLLVTNDSGPMHLASVMDVPVVALFGPTSELRTGPHGKKSKVVTSDVTCRPCFKRECPKEKLDCMKGITVEDVLEISKEVMAGRD